MFWYVFGILTTIILIVFLLFTMRILFVFMKGFKKNTVLNKSVSKSVFTGKTSLIIILLFYGVSFSLVGGATLQSTASEKTYEKQFSENNVYQLDFHGNFFNQEDSIMNYYAYYYNNVINSADSGISPVNYDNYVTPWLIDHTLTKNTIDFFTSDEYKFNYFQSENGYVSVDNFISKNAEDVLGVEANNTSFGWTKSEWKIAFEYQMTNYVDNTAYGQKWSASDSLYLAIQETYFDNSTLDLATFLLNYEMLSGESLMHLSSDYEYFGVTNSYAIENEYEYNKVSKELYDEWDVVSQHISYRALSYMNVSPTGSSSIGNTDMEVVTYLDNPRFNTKNSSGDYVNQTIYNNKSFEEFSNEDTRDGNRYKVLLQEDYAEENDLNVGDEIPVSFSTNEVSSAKLEIYDIVRFSEITYPTMGLNVLPDKSQQTFIGMNAADFLYFSQTANYNSLYNRDLTFFISTDWGNNNLDSTDAWLPESKEFDEIRDRTEEYVNLIYNDWIDVYNIDLIQATENGYIQNIVNTGINVKEYIKIDSTDLKWVDENGTTKPYLTGTTDRSEVFDYSNDLSSAESVRLVFGMIQIDNNQRLINILVIIFMVIILIVLVMLVSKRVKSSSKQLGTLKAMGTKNSTIASAYIIFPMLIIFIGFAIAAVISPFIMIMFERINSSFYYISYGVNPLSFAFFFKMLLIPLVLSIVISYVISILILRKPTLDLLTNKANDEPNIFVRASGYVTPAKTPFSISYISKGALGALGKSSLLFISILLATFLTAFSMSSSTMVKTQTENSLRYLNFDSYTTTKNINNGQYNYEALYPLDENTNEFSKSYDDQIEIEPMKKIDFIQYLNSPTWSEENYNDYMNSLYITLTGQELMAMSKNSTESSAYISKELMEQIVIAKTYFSLTYNNENDPDETFNDYERNLENQDDNIFTLSDLDFIISEWIFDTTMNAVNDGFINSDSLGNIDDISTEVLNYLNDIEKYMTDVTFGTAYYNQYSQVLIGEYKLRPYNLAINTDQDIYDSYYESKNKDKDSVYNSYIYFNSFYSEQEFKNAYGRDDSELSDELWDESFGKYNEDDEVLEEYIPVIATTQSYNELQEMVDDGYVIDKGDDIYQVSISMPFSEYQIDEQGNKTLEFKDEALNVDIKVEETVFYGIDTGVTTFAPYMKTYFENYEYQNVTNTPLGFDSEQQTYYYEDYDGEITYFEKRTNLYGDFSYLGYDRSALYNISEYKNLDNKPLPTDNKNIYATTSITPSVEAWEYYNNSFPGETWSIDMNTIIDDKDLVPELQYTPKTFDDLFYSPQGIPIYVNTLLTQGKIIYDVIIATFIIISIFAIFMSMTIIIIAMKDIIDSSKREISMLKAFGYSNTKATTLTMAPYIIIVLLAFLIALPLTFIGLGAVAGILTSLTGNAFVFTLTSIQWIIISSYILGLILVLFIIAYITFSRTNALEAIRETDD